MNYILSTAKDMVEVVRDTVVEVVAAEFGLVTVKASRWRQVTELVDLAARAWMVASESARPTNEAFRAY